MADETTNTNNAESFHDADEPTDLSRKIETLEHENRDLNEENKKMQERVDELMSEIDEWRREEIVVKEKIEQMGKQLEDSQENSRALDSVAARCADLEGEVVRLQDELVAAVTDADDKRKEVDAFKKRVEGLESEVEGLKKSRAELERTVREYERKLGLLEMKESEEKSKKLRVDEELREKVAEIVDLKKKLKDAEGKVVEAEKRVAFLSEEKMVDGINGIREIGDEDGSKISALAVGSGAVVVVAAAALVYFRYTRKN